MLKFAFLSQGVYNKIYIYPLYDTMADPLMTGNVEAKTAPEAPKAAETTTPPSTPTVAPATTEVAATPQLAAHESTSLVDTIIKVIIDIIAKITGKPSPTGGKVPTWR